MKLKIGSYNIAAMSRVGHDPDVIAGDIVSQQPDIVGFQEVDRFSARSGYHDMMKELSEKTGYQYYYFAHAIDLAGDEATYGQAGEYGVGILSKYPIVSSEYIQLSSGGHEQRVLAHAEIDAQGTTIHFFNTHLSYENDGVRVRQLEQIDAYIAGYENRILTGDFNVRSTEELEALCSMGRVVNKDNPLQTYKGADWSTNSIDNICFSRDFCAGESEVYDKSHSDHKLLIATLTYSVEK